MKSTLLSSKQGLRDQKASINVFVFAAQTAPTWPVNLAEVFLNVCDGWQILLSEVNLDSVSHAG